MLIKACMNRVGLVSTEVSPEAESQYKQGITYEDLLVLDF